MYIVVNSVPLLCCCAFVLGSCENVEDDLWKSSDEMRLSSPSPHNVKRKTVYVQLIPPIETAKHEPSYWPMPVSENTMRKVTELLVHVLNINLLCSTNVWYEYNESVTRDTHETVVYVGFVMGGRILTWHGPTRPYYDYLINWNNYVTGQGVQNTFAYIMAHIIDTWHDLDAIVHVLMHELGHAAGMNHTPLEYENYTMYMYSHRPRKLSKFFRSNYVERIYTIEKSKLSQIDKLRKNKQCYDKSYDVILNRIDTYYENVLKPHWYLYERHANITKEKLFEIYDAVNYPVLSQYNGNEVTVTKIEDILSNVLTYMYDVQIYTIVPLPNDEMRLYLAESPNGMYIRMSTVGRNKCFVSRKPSMPRPAQHHSSYVQCDTNLIRHNIASITFRNGTTYYSDGMYIYEHKRCRYNEVMYVHDFINILCDYKYVDHKI